MKGSRTLEKIKGRVEAQTVLRGTASEHKGIVLTTDEGERLRLQRIGGNPFADPVTQALAGSEVSLEGFRLGSVFRFNRVCDREGDQIPRAKAKAHGSKKKKFRSSL